MANKSDTLMMGAHTGSVNGFAIGNSFMPGIGGAIGGVAGALGGLFAGSRKQKREEKALRERERAWQEAKTQLALERRNYQQGAHQVFNNAYTPANNSMGEMYGKGSQIDMSKNPLASRNPLEAMSTEDLVYAYKNGHITEDEFWGVQGKRNKNKRGNPVEGSGNRKPAGGRGKGGKPPRTPPSKPSGKVDPQSRRQSYDPVRHQK